ncbi:GrpB family protein [Arthrobacter sp. ZGTC212]|uniref:GrpB family protein n=1 Tax=Arthrobacter sp. ZGTC212 TaxID=2058899 RepID=UPI000CE56C24|nr:GrpB family protein [Arthrobacter sp. ZGTC212]
MTPDQPVFLVPSRYSEWTGMAAEMMDKIRQQVHGVHLEHIGSTAVPDLPAKDVVDILVGVEADRVSSVSRHLATIGFDLEGERDRHCWLSHPSRSSRSYIVHVVEFESLPWCRRISFRDLLRSDESARTEYLHTKVRAAEAARNWDDYTQSKTSVVSNLLSGSASEKS